MNWPDVRNIENITEHQREELAKAISRAGSLAILGGSPGCGKTWTTAQLVKSAGEQIGYRRIGVAAPTGKAAVRLTEAMAEYDVPLRAVTWHSMLGVEANDSEGWSFRYNAGNPLPYSLLVGDEMSMLDVDLAQSVFSARGRGTKFLVIGDVHQLPPVGHGAPLRDMIASGVVPYGELREIMRNDGGIVQACADIRDGKRFRCEGNLRSVPARGAVAIKDSLLETISDSSRAFGVDAVWDVQVLVAVNSKGDLCRKDINLLLQNALNANPEIPGSPFRLGDKVVNTKNGWFKPSEHHRGGCMDENDNGEIYVANGELGKVIVAQPKVMHVSLSSPDRTVLVPRGAAPPTDESNTDEDDASPGTGCNWDLGYALSCHKSQGSEWPIAIVVIDDGGSARRVCSREWIYTAMSRAKQCCYLVGPLEVAQGFASRTAINLRKTFLAELIKDMVAPL